MRLPAWCMVMCYDLGLMRHRQDLTGEAFGLLEVVKAAPDHPKYGWPMWLCRCACGERITRSTSSLRSRSNHSCGCTGVVDLTGKIFGYLSVLRRDRNRRRGIWWAVRCDAPNCGVLKSVISGNLRNQQSCGCVRPGKRSALLGKTFGLLTVRRFVGNANVSKAALWECTCACSGSITLTTARLRAADEPNCGCLTWQHFHRAKKFHGHSRLKNGRPSRTYSTWHSMLERCTFKTKHVHRERYADRGIRVCKRWQGPRGFVNFLFDMGERPQGMTLDRKNNDRGYSPANCRWATPKQQANNRETATDLRQKIVRLERQVSRLERRLAQQLSLGYGYSAGSVAKS
jgi:hypothetical protein